MPVPIFDLDGTLLDSDAALADAYVALGVPRERVTFGHVVTEECARLGIDVADYLAAYDSAGVRPFDGIPTLLAGLARWAVCSNKHGPAGRAELARLGWEPNVAKFADAFDGPKSLRPVLDALGVAAGECLFVGDTDHDLRCARDAGVRFVVAGWNPRTADLTGDERIERPADLLDLLG